MSESPKSFFNTLPGILTGLASLIVAITGLYAATDGFTFGSGTEPARQEKVVVDNSEEEHRRQLDALKRKQELDELNIALEKKRLLAEQELAALKARNAGLADSNQPGNMPVNQVRAASPAQANISGNWAFTNIVGTYTFTLQQNGNDITLREFDAYGNNVGNGTGTIQGEQVYLTWVEPYLFVMSLEVEANLTLTADGRAMHGAMYTDDSSVQISLFRQ